MDLQRARYALAVIDHGSFTAAARACFVAQPSLSQAIKSLERELGSDLFQRVGRRIVVTPAGEAFAAAARPAVRAFDAVPQAVEAVVGLVAGRLDLVALPTLAVSPVAQLVGAFRAQHPGVLVRLAHPDRSAGLLAALHSGISEVGITELPVPRAGMRTHALGTQELVAVLPPGAARQRSISVRSLAAWPLVLQSTGTATRDHLDRLLAKAGIEPTVAVETDQREAIVPLVLAGAGAALLPLSMAEAAAGAGAVVVPLNPPQHRRLAVIHRAGVLTPAAKAFVELARG